MAEFQHHPRHVAVRLRGELTLAAATDLTETVDMLVRVYHYTLVEITVSSPGGVETALAHYLDAQRRWRRRGVRVRTRVVEAARSAGALLASLGDERVAEKSATLQYHFFRLDPGGALTAAESVDLLAHLSSLDTRYLRRLVERALEGARAARMVSAPVEASDHRVLEVLSAGLDAGATARPHTPRGLARLLERAVRRAVRARDDAALETLYRTLFHADRAISPAVARLLRLIDGVGTPAPEPARAPGRPGLAIPQWAALYAPGGAISREILTRHTLALGDTGSGKTASAILPFVRALLRAPAGRFGGALVVDPKGEIGPMVEREAPERVRAIVPSRTGLDLMAGPDWSVAGDLAACRHLSAATRILLRVLGFDPTLPTRVLGEHPVAAGSSHAEFFDREGTALLRDVLAFVLLVVDARAAPPEAWCAGAACAWMRSLLERARGGAGGRGHNALALAAFALDTGFALDDSDDDERFHRAARPWLFARAVRGVHCALAGVPGEIGDLLQRVGDYWLPMSETLPRQFAAVVSSARVACGAIAEPGLATTLYFGCEPGAAGTEALSRELARAVSRDAPGRVLLYQPPRSGRDPLVGKALKAAFFEAVFNDPDRARGGAELPLVGYVADEFHKLVTSDPVHGEASFLDTCRSFGVACVLACQSMASIEHALAQRGGSAMRDRAAVSILWTNTGSKLFFRSTDPRTADRVDEVCPVWPGLTRVTHVRPLSSLAPGECYAALADGRFERRQLEPVLPGAPERTMARRRARRPRDRRRGTESC